VVGDVRAHAGRCHACEEAVERARHGLLGALVRRRVQVAGGVPGVGVRGWNGGGYEGGNPPPSYTHTPRIVRGAQPPNL